MAILEEMEAGGQLLAELPDDTDDAHFVPAPCQIACPVGTDAPSYIAYIWERRFEEAFEAITATNPFSSICGRVCDAPCEPACRRTDSDGPVQIRNLKRFVMDEVGHDYDPPPVPVRHEQSVAVVGSGPAGLTAAQEPLGRGLQGACLRDDRPARRHDDLGHSRRSGCRPGSSRRISTAWLAAAPDGGSPRHRARAGRDAGRSQGAARRGGSRHRCVVGQEDGHSGRGPHQCDRRCAVPARRERGRPARDAGDGCGDRRRRRRDGRLPGREAPTGLQARQGDLPAGPGGDPGAQDRARRRDRGGDRVHLSHPADRHRAAGQRACGALR